MNLLDLNDFLILFWLMTVKTRFLQIYRIPSHADMHTMRLSGTFLYVRYL